MEADPFLVAEQGELFPTVEADNHGAAPMLDRLLMTEPISGVVHSELYELWEAEHHHAD